MEISREKIIEQVLQSQDIKSDINRFVICFETLDNKIIQSEVLVKDLVKVIFEKIENILDEFLKNHGMRGFKIIIPNVYETIAIDIINISTKITIESVITFLRKSMPITFDLVYHGRTLISIKNIDCDNRIESIIYHLKNYDERKALRTFIKHLTAE